MDFPQPMVIQSMVCKKPSYNINVQQIPKTIQFDKQSAIPKYYDLSMTTLLNPNYSKYINVITNLAISQNVKCILNMAYNNFIISNCEIDITIDDKPVHVILTTEKDEQGPYSALRIWAESNGKTFDELLIGLKHK